MVSDSLGSMIFVIAKILEQPGYIQIQMLMVSASYMGKMGIFFFKLHSSLFNVSWYHTMLQGAYEKEKYIGSFAWDFLFVFNQSVLQKH